jgi:hypothetical protein
MAVATLKKTLPGTRHFFDWDYTRARPQPRLEICIEQIRFSDSLPAQLARQVQCSLPWVH